MSEPERAPEVIVKIFIEICERMVNGESLSAICKKPPTNGPTSSSVLFSWMHKWPELERLYIVAQEQRAETHVDEIIDIADNASNDWMERNDPENPGWVANHEHINRSRLRVDTRKWAACKMKPKRYGDRVQLSGDAETPLSVAVKFIKADER